jgi:retron-type reverse transcriptase
VRAADKPFSIDKKLVYEAYKAVKANAGAAGVDGQTIEQFGSSATALMAGQRQDRMAG